jgi:hypothetical protein
MDGMDFLSQSLVMDIKQPSNEVRAILVEYLPGDDKRIASQGTLFAILDHIKFIADKDRRAYMIELPDQTSPPFGYGWVHFDELIAQTKAS